MPGRSAVGRLPRGRYAWLRRPLVLGLGPSVRSGEEERPRYLQGSRCQLPSREDRRPASATISAAQDPRAVICPDDLAWEGEDSRLARRANNPPVPLCRNGGDRRLEARRTCKGGQGLNDEDQPQQPCQEMPPHTPLTPASFSGLQATSWAGFPTTGEVLADRLWKRLPSARWRPSTPAAGRGEQTLEDVVASLPS